MKGAWNFPEREQRVWEEARVGLGQSAGGWEGRKQCLYSIPTRI